MANRTIQCADRYLAVLYDYLHEKMYGCHVLQADETPVLVNKDGRPVGSKSYMWVYRTGRMYADRQIVLYEYQRSRNASHPREFLKKSSGICVTDGYQVCHTIEGEREDLRIAGCWSHARRRFDEAVKALPKAKQKDSRASDHDPGNLPGRKTVKRTSPTGETEPPPVKRQTAGGGLYHMGA